MEQFFYLPSTMIWPLAACLVLTGIHVYLGVHVVARKVIFVDLALAQIAALGTVIGVLLGYEVGKDLTALYLYSLAFTIFGAFIFSATRMKGERVPHEAIIGIVYAVTFAATILVLSKSALGPQELDHIIKGELLWVQGHVVIKTAIIYALVGAFHFIFRKKFMAISFNPEQAEANGINVRLWDFLFYMSFGFVITSSVAIAGVFLVFSYLVIPSVGAMLLSEKLSTRLAIGWTAGAIISFIGVKLSWTTGLPTSPLVVVLLATGLLISGISRYLKHAPSIAIAFRNLAGGAIVVALFIGGVFYFGKPVEKPLDHALQLLSSEASTERQSGIAMLASFPDAQSDWQPLVMKSLHDNDAEVRKAAIGLLSRFQVVTAEKEILALLSDKSDDVRQAVLGAAKAYGDQDAGTVILQSAQKEDDPEMKIEMLETALLLRKAEAIPLLASMIEDGGIFASDAYDHLQSHVAFTFSIKETGKVKRWYEANRQKLVWNASTGKFAAKEG
ncbi:MAG TPA: iron chelate uptake ABC transporter family permease subunit [Bacteroidota bacterium]|nr:iron chelate uptake ABC transporter family permease subunit [Bacteroidota bacterium]